MRQVPGCLNFERTPSVRAPAAATILQFCNSQAASCRVVGCADAGSRGAALAPLARLRGAPARGAGAAGQPDRRHVAALPEVRQVSSCRGVQSTRQLLAARYARPRHADSRRQDGQRTCKVQLDIHNARRRRAYAAARRRAARTAKAATSPLAPPVAAPRRVRKPDACEAYEAAARRASAQAEAVYASVLQPPQHLAGLAALLLPALAAMHHAPQPAAAPPYVLQSLGLLGAEDVLRACLSGLLQHLFQPQAPPPPPGFDLARMLLSAQQLQPPPSFPCAPSAWPSGPPPPPPHV
jgi:hypothetical protein